MPRLYLVEADGRRHALDVSEGESVMEAAVKHAVPGILGECGGNCACGTCRVYVDDERWRALTGSASELERAMLDYVADDEPQARLGCQLRVTTVLDGIELRMPAEQIRV